jgi:flagellin-like hook-associated protein FlgL
VGSLLLSAESRVMDMDTSEETMELVKGGILEKAASVIPAQAH